MDKNTVIGLVLIVAVLIGFSYFSKSDQPAPQPQTTQTTQPVQAEQPKEVAAATAPVDTVTPFKASFAATDSVAAADKDSVVVLENDNLTIHVNKHGGTVSDVWLKGYRSYDDFKNDTQAPLHLFDSKNAALNLSLQTTAGTINTADYRFVAAEQKGKNEVTMLLQAADSTALAITYTLQEGDGYMLTMTVASRGLGRHLAAGKPLGIHWTQKIAQHEKGYDFENQYSTITYKLTGDDTEKLREMGDDEEVAEGDADWVAFKNQYFSSVMIAPTSTFRGLHMVSRQITPEVEAGYLKYYDARAEIPFDATGKQATTLHFYYGPNSFNLLKSMDRYKLGTKDYDLEDLVYLGWPIVRWINRFFTIYVFDFLTRLGLPMGIVLLLITILLRFIVYVPTRKSFLSSAKMRVLRPKVDEISRKYPDKADAMKKQQEMMALYSQYGVSPMGGCLPMLIQMPIWIAMFNFVPNAIELRQQGFLWADDLSTYDSVINFGTHIWGIGDHLSLFCLLFCATNLLYSYMTIRQQRESMAGE
ncbi:MAG: membrane protein insertase YidC, partial [Alloprevotella sp.]|nr:membrane protein insertase YidC [Alloprevotella sp.]